MIDSCGTVHTTVYALQCTYFVTATLVRGVDGAPFLKSHNTTVDREG